MNNQERVIAILRDNLKLDSSVPDEEILKKTEGTALRAFAHLQAFREECRACFPGIETAKKAFLRLSRALGRTTKQ